LSLSAVEWKQGEVSTGTRKCQQSKETAHRNTAGIHALYYICMFYKKYLTTYNLFNRLVFHWMRISTFMFDMGDMLEIINDWAD
jgi:hypothetical protein